MNLHDTIVWITGASSGIGRALAVECARQGATLMLTARRLEALEETRRMCERPEVHACLAHDVTDAGAHDSIIQAILQRWGRLDILVLNAGIGQRGSVAETDPAVERHLMEVNYFGQTEVLHAALPHFLHRGKGQVVVVTSIMGKVATPRRATYAAAKHALHGYFEALRAELFRTDISITLLCTGYIKTPISLSSVKGSGAAYGTMDDQHRNAMPAEVYARKAVRAIVKRRPVAYLGGPERFGPMLARLSPALVRWLLPRIITRD
jgi:dehydrogenase/reductase SDR family protein 7B